MKAIILLKTLKKDGLSNTETLAEFLPERMKSKDVEGDFASLSKNTYQF